MKSSLNRIVASTALILVLCLCVSPAAFSKELYVAYADTSDNFHLGTIDSANPEVVQKVGTLGKKLIRALEFSGDGKLYAYENQLWGPSQLYEVDPTTAALTPIGPSGSQRIDGMAYNPIDGKMYGVEAYYTSSLYSIDLDTGAVTFEGNISENGPVPWSWIAGIAVDDQGYFYIYNNARDNTISDKGIYRSTTPGGLEFEMIYDLLDEFGLDPNGSTTLQTPSPLFMDWSSGDVRGYGWLREWNNFDTGYYGYDWDDQGLSWTRHPLYPSHNQLFYAWTADPKAVPVADIKANGSDNPITIFTGQSLNVEVSLDPGLEEGAYADWWLLADSNFGWYRYNLGSSNWVPGFRTTHMGPLTTFGPFTAYNGMTLPAGSYTFYFGVDMDMNGSLDMGQMYSDSVDVTVL